jgi:glucose-6-phosphate isomerase
MTVEEAWNALARAAGRLKRAHLRDLFAEDPERFDRFSVRLDDLTLDYSKEKIDAGALAALLDLARAAGVEAKRDALLAGEPVNLTEGRAALHSALRAGPEASTEVDGVPVAPLIHATLERMLAFAEDLRAGRAASAGGAPFADVVNIGIGGSDLGPAMAARALSPDADGPRVHFVSNVDGAHLADVLRGLDPARTLFVVASKTFTTLETMTNARSARAWLAAALGEAQAGAHLAAVSTNLEATAAFGIPDARVFGFWDWVGGRYSLWSAIGLPVAIAVGADNFRAFLAGARAMDAHFAAAPLPDNLPVLLALIGIWRRNAMGWPTVALIPYDQRLERFPAYVQQLDMESNGKRVTRGGAPVAGATGPVIWGEPGTNAQHSFFQLLHQGTDVIPVDFIAAAQPREDMGDHHALLLANCLAQSEALAFGKSEAEVRAEMAGEGRAAAEIERLAAHRTFPGDRPSTTILQRRLDPFALGRLIALYEHKVFVQGAVWDVNSFDQWGVELGKQLAATLIPMVKGEAAPDGKDASTAGLIARLRALEE